MMRKEKDLDSASIFYYLRCHIMHFSYVILGNSISIHIFYMSNTLHMGNKISKTDILSTNIIW